jgi:hypothetical protein
MRTNKSKTMQQTTQWRLNKIRQRRGGERNDNERKDKGERTEREASNDEDKSNLDTEILEEPREIRLKNKKQEEEMTREDLARPPRWDRGTTPTAMNEETRSLVGQGQVSDRKKRSRGSFEGRANEQTNEPTTARGQKRKREQDNEDNEKRERKRKKRE